MQPTPSISVLMPCCDAAATLPEALDSLLAQTLQDFEIIAVDDGSSDTTLAILCLYASREPRLRILAQPHSGLVASLNAGLRSRNGTQHSRFVSL